MGKSSLHNGATRRDSEMEALNWHIGKPKKELLINFYSLYVNVHPFK